MTESMNPVQDLSISGLVDWLLTHNQRQSQQFRSPDASSLRHQYRAVHPTEILVLKCMDGRLNFPPMTNTPLGILQPIRNLGGIFDLGWPYLGEVVTDWVNYAMEKGRDCMIFVTYHWSKGDKHRGCRGFNYDVEEARKYTGRLKQQIERMYGAGHSTVYPIVCGVETDLDALVLHGEHDEVMDLAGALNLTEGDLKIKLRQLFPTMRPKILNDLLPIVLGNIAHIAEIRAAQRPVFDAEHRERVLGIGRGFDWLHWLNLALIVGPFDPDLVKPIKTAAALLAGNIKEGRIRPDGIVLLASAPYREEAGFDVPRAIEKARFLSRFSLDIIQQEVPELRELVVPLVGIVNMNTREFTRLEK